MGRRLTWQFTKDNWEELHKRYQGGFLLSRLIKVRDRLFELFSIQFQKYLPYQTKHCQSPVQRNSNFRDKVGLFFGRSEEKQSDIIYFVR